MLIVLAVTVVAVIGWLLLRKRRSASDDAGSVDTEPSELPAPISGSSEPAPMTGLESALSQVTDRSGRPIREKIDAEAGHVDELRVPDDTGPLLRRALDSVLPHDDQDDHGDADDSAPSA